MHVEQLGILPVKLNTVFRNFLFIFLIKFELDVNSFGSRKIVDNIEVVPLP